MNNDMIAKFCETQKVATGNCVRIDFKKRSPVFGFLVQTGDYEDLRSKNFWRIVIHKNIQTWQKNGDMDLAKIYNGSEFSKLSVISLKELLSIA